MQTQVKGARPKQKNYEGQRTLDRDKRKLPHSNNDEARRVFVSSTTSKRAFARFAKGPSETGGFMYPRQCLVSSVVIPDVLAAPLVIVCETELPIEVESASTESFKLATNDLGIVEQIVDDSLHEESSTESFLDVDQQSCKSISPTSNNNEQIIGASSDVLKESAQSISPASNNEQIVGASSDVSKEVQRNGSFPTDVACLNIEGSKAVDSMCNVPQVTDHKPIDELHETLDDTIGPGSSESESSDEEGNDVQVSKPIIVVAAKPSKPKVISPPVTRKPLGPVSNVSRKVTPVSPSVARSSWSKFLPLVIEIKATVPYPMHFLGLTLFVGICLLLRLLYQFGAGLGEGMDLQGQLLTLAKLAFLFVAIVVCVNFVEDNKELPVEPAPAQHKLRPSKITKNKKKLMMKV